VGLLERLDSFVRERAEEDGEPQMVGVLGPMREKRNGGTSASTEAASVRSRPPELSARSPSPMTK